jgi:hypothetical protein
MSETGFGPLVLRPQSKRSQPLLHAGAIGEGGLRGIHMLERYDRGADVQAEQGCVSRRMGPLLAHLDEDVKVRCRNWQISDSKDTRGIGASGAVETKRGGERDGDRGARPRSVYSSSAPRKGRGRTPAITFQPLSVRSLAPDAVYTSPACTAAAPT